MSDTDGLLYRDQLLLGMDELQWLQAENDEKARKARVASMLTYGLVVGRCGDGSLEDQWRLDDADDDGSISLTVASGTADRPTMACFVDHDGYFVTVDTAEAEALELPDDDTWHTVTVERVATQYEIGSILLTNGSAVVTGTNTRFTRFSGRTSSGFNRGTKIRIDAADSANGFEGTYEIDEIVSDTQLTLTAVLVGGSPETIAQWTVAGGFFVTTPADPDIHQRSQAKLTRQTGIVREPAAGLMPLYDVKRNDAGSPKVLFIDRRHQRMLRSAVPWGLRTSQITHLALESQADVSAGFGGSPYQMNVTYGSIAIGVAHVVANAVAPCVSATGQRGRFLHVHEEGGDLHTGRQDSRGHVNGATDTGAAVFAGSEPALVRMPEASGFTHALLYTAAGVLYCKRTTNNGTTWGSAVTVLDPTGADPLNTVAFPSAIRLLNGRLHVAMEYYNDALGQKFITSVFSDDHGTTWDTNLAVSGAGYIIKLISLPLASERDASRPSLGQSADGRIWCAYTIGPVGGVSTDIGITSTDNASGEWGSPVLTSEILTDWADSDVNTPILWISPDGQPIIVFHEWKDGASWIRYWVIGESRGACDIIYSRQLLTLNAALGQIQDMGLAMCQLEGGALVLATVDTTSTVNDAFAVSLTPISVGYQEGGAQRYRTT